MSSSTLPRRLTERSYLIVLALWLCLVGPTSPSFAADLQPVRFVMDNGLTVLVLEQHYLPLVHVQALVKVGSAQDPSRQAGLANLASSLLDEGTTSRSSTQIAELIDEVGGSLGSHTEEDFTTAYARVLTKDVELGFDLLSDIVRRPAFADSEFSRVKNQLLGELVSEQDDPSRIATIAFSKLVYSGHPYHWPVTGTEESLGTITREDVQHFHTREYLPNQTILVVVGDISEARAKALIAKYFASWTRGDIPARQISSPLPINRPITQLIDKDLTQATIMLGHLGISRTNPDFYAVTVMNYILGAGGFSSRLMNSIRDNQGLAYGVGSHYDANLLTGSFAVSLQTRNETARQAIAAVLKELRGIRESIVTDQELAEAKAYLTGSFPLRLDTTSKVADLLSFVEFYGLGLNYFTDYPQSIDRVTKEDVQRTARQYLDPDHYALVLVGNLAKAQIQ